MIVSKHNFCLLFTPKWYRLEIHLSGTWCQIETAHASTADVRKTTTCAILILLLKSFTPFVYFDDLTCRLKQTQYDKEITSQVRFFHHIQCKLHVKKDMETFFMMKIKSEILFFVWAKLINLAKKPMTNIRTR